MTDVEAGFSEFIIIILIVVIVTFFLLILLPNILYLVKYIHNDSDKMKVPSLYSSIIWGLFALISLILYIVDYVYGDLERYSYSSPISGAYVIACLCIFSVHLIIFINVLYSKEHYYDVLDNNFYLFELLIMTIFMVTLCIIFYNAISIDTVGVVLSIVQFVIQMLNYTLLCVWISNNDRCYQDSDVKFEESIEKNDKRLFVIFGIMVFSLIFSFTIIASFKKNDMERFVGKWESDNGHQIVVFDDGTLYMYSEKYNIDSNEKEIKIDKWKMDNGSLIMERSGYRTIISSYEFQDNDIIIIGSPDETTAKSIYRRKN